MKKLVMTLVILVVMTSSAKALDFEAGKVAHIRGDFETALSIWKPLAEARNPEAQSSLGKMYIHGKEVQEDHAEAMMWFQRAADQCSSERASLA